MFSNVLKWFLQLSHEDACLVKGRLFLLSILGYFFLALLRVIFLLARVVLVLVLVVLVLVLVEVFLAVIFGETGGLVTA